MANPHLGHLLLQGVAAGRVQGAETGQGDVRRGQDVSGLTQRAEIRLGTSHLASCPLWTSYLSVWYLSVRTVCRSDFSRRRWSETQTDVMTRGRHGGRGDTPCPQSVPTHTGGRSPQRSVSELGPWASAAPRCVSSKCSRRAAPPSPPGRPHQSVTLAPPTETERDTRRDWRMSCVLQGMMGVNRSTKQVGSELQLGSEPKQTRLYIWEHPVLWHTEPGTDPSTSGEGLNRQQKERHISVQESAASTLLDWGYHGNRTGTGVNWIRNLNQT